MVLTSALSAVAAAPGPASAQVGPPDRQALRTRLLDATGGRGRLADHLATGKLRFFGTTPDRPVARSANVGPGASPEAGARSFLATYGPLFGASDPGRDLRIGHIAAADRGRSSVRFQQLHQGVPVLGGELVVNLDGQRNVLSANGELSPEKSLDVAPAIGVTEAVSYTHLTLPTICSV